MGRKTTKQHLVNSDDAHYLKQHARLNNLTVAELQRLLPYPIHSQSLYAGLRGDLVTFDTKEAIETAAASLRKQGKTVRAPVLSSH